MSVSRSGDLWTGAHPGKVHVWEPDVAPDYHCVLPGCGVTGQRMLRLAGKPVRAVDPAAAHRADLYRQMLAEGDLARREGRVEQPEPPRIAAVDEQMEAHAMGRRTPVGRHRWAEADDEALRDAVAVVYGDDDAARSPKVASWSAVAGRLLPDLVVTPAACRARHAWLREEERRAARVRLEAEALAEEAVAEREERAAVSSDVTEDAWQRAERMVDEYEADTLDRILARLDGLSDAVAETQAAVARLEAMWR